VDLESSSQSLKVLDVAAVAVMTTGTTTKTGATKLRRHLSAKKKRKQLTRKKNQKCGKISLSKRDLEILSLGQT